MTQRVFRGAARWALCLAVSGCSEPPSDGVPQSSPSTGGTQNAGGGAGLAGSTTGGSGVATSGGSSGASAGAAGSGGSGGQAGASVGTGCKGAAVCFDFEQGTIPAGWTLAMVQGSGATVVDSDKAHSGKFALHMKNFSGDQPQHSLLAQLPANFGGTLWGRAFVYNTPKGPAEHGSLIKARYANASSPDIDWYEVGYELARYDGIWHSPLPPSGLPEWTLRSDTDIAIDRWTCVEWLFDGQNGSAPEAADPRIWQDGSEVNWLEKFVYDDPAVPMDTPRPNTPKATNFVSFEVGLTMYHVLPDVTNIYLDDLAFGPERVGCND
jgi:hypothetical protein